MLRQAEKTRKSEKIGLPEHNCARGKNLEFARKIKACSTVSAPIFNKV